jgi:hypothetical protein
MGFLKLNSPRMGFSMKYIPSITVDSSLEIFFMGKMTEERQ